MTKSPRWIAILFLTLAASLSWNSPQLFAQTDPLTVQVASYLRASDAQAAVNRLRAKKLDAYWVKAEIPGMGTRYRVRLGRYSVEDDATLGAAQACKSRAISQYLVANGETVPVGVPAKTCKFAIATAARLNPKSDKAGQLAANVPTAPSTKMTAPTKEPIAPTVVKNKPQPVVAPKVAEKASVKLLPVSPNAADTVAPAQPVTKATSKNTVRLPDMNAAPKAVAVTAAAPKNSKVIGHGFVPASAPKEIVANAYKYAAARVGNASASGASPAAMAKPLANSGGFIEPPPPTMGVNSLIARSIAAPGATNDLAIASSPFVRRS